MLTQQELKEKYAMLYDYMATSKKTEYMKAFGKAMNEMMDWFVVNKPEAAQEWVEQLCAIKWNNYLTSKEAEAIVAKIKPEAPWRREVWSKAMEGFGIVKEEEPYYNSCALWVVMNMIYSDSAHTIASLMEAPLEEIPQQQLVKAVHSFALDKLKDKDGVFNVRKYFGLQ